MTNVSMTVKGSILTVQVDLSKSFGQSASGKSTIIASTQGSVTVPYKGKEIKLGLNVYAK